MDKTDEEILKNDPELANLYTDDEDGDEEGDGESNGGLGSPGTAGSDGCNSGMTWCICHSRNRVLGPIR